MSRRLDVINLGDPAQRPAPTMMSSCETGGCGGGPEPLIPPPPTFSEVRVNGVEITPEVADGPRSVVLEQVTWGVAVRMAVLSLLAK